MENLTAKGAKEKRAKGAEKQLLCVFSFASFAFNSPLFLTLN
jgi:hypothetical protein